MTVGELRAQIEDVADDAEVIAITWEEWRDVFDANVEKAREHYGHDVFVLIGHERDVQ